LPTGRKEVESFLMPGYIVSPPLEVPDRGYYVRPTVYSQVAPESRLAQEEIFGPVLVRPDSDAR
jgi:aldehyde dehydrogenase (NAD+)